MRKATLVLATTVAFFFVISAHAGTRKNVTMPSAQSVVEGAGNAVRDGDRIRIPGEPGVEYIPRTPGGTKGVPVKVLPTIDYSIPRTINQVKNVIRGGAAQIAVSAAIAAMVASLDWVMTDGVLTKKKEVTAPPEQYCWKFSESVIGTQCTTPSALASAYCAFGGYSGCKVVYIAADGTGAVSSGDGVRNAGIKSQGVCPGHITSFGDCSLGTIDTPVTEADYPSIDNFVNSADPNWIKGLIKEACQGSLNPSACIDGLVATSSLAGPTVVQGPRTSTLERGPNGISQVNSNTVYSLVYGPNYFTYTPTTTTTKVNPDGTTEETTETDQEDSPDEEEPQAPALGDPYAPVIDKYKDIATEVSNPPQVPANVNYSPWYSFGGSCSELNFVLPIYGSYTTNICPYIYDWVRPVLAFLLAMYTWHRCREMWTEALRIARPI